MQANLRNQELPQAQTARPDFLPKVKLEQSKRSRNMAETLHNRALQNHASCFSIRSSMHPARSLQEEDTYFDDGLIPRALNIRRPYLHENETSPTGRYMNRFGTAEERQDQTPKGQLRVVNPDVDADHASHHQPRAAIYLVSLLMFFIVIWTDS